MDCSVSSDILGKHRFEVVIVWVFWDGAYITSYIREGTPVGAHAQTPTPVFRIHF